MLITITLLGSNCLGLFYASGLGNGVYCTFITVLLLSASEVV